MEYDFLMRFFEVIPIHYVILMFLSIGMTHILKILGGNMFPVVSKTKSNWLTYSVLSSITSGGSLALISTYRLPELFLIDPIVLVIIYMIMTPYIGAMLMHSELRMFNGMKTHTDKKFSKESADNKK